MKKSIIVSAVCVVCAAFSLISACNTVNGFGRDVKKTGNEIQKAAN